MKFSNIPEITTILSLFTSLCATQGVNSGNAKYKCSGVIFYSESINASTAMASTINIGSLNGYPAPYPVYGLSGTAPYHLFPMVKDVMVYAGGVVSKFFLIIDINGIEQGMVYVREGYEGYLPCTAM
ncbi:unnamed protein product [Blumeria hordei]|uniref:Uncharacterized protein n=1 Tax=Blumeria hordei TaxID=2867405 RepID=A0A383V3Z9_BLUHO|nr:unnamed protein product [Blumeria hordei]